MGHTRAREALPAISCLGGPKRAPFPPHGHHLPPRRCHCPPSSPSTGAVFPLLHPSQPPFPSPAVLHGCCFAPHGHHFPPHGCHFSPYGHHFSPYRASQAPLPPSKPLTGTISPSPPLTGATFPLKTLHGRHFPPHGHHVSPYHSS